MHRTLLLHRLQCYGNSSRFMQEEQAHLTEIMRFINTYPGCFEREHQGHITGSAWVINHDQTHALLTHHKKLAMWVQLGGHADGNPDIPAVALREAHEESGIDDLWLVSQDIFDIDIHPIPNKCLYHYDIRYLIKAPRDAQYTVSEESHDLAWVRFDEIETYTSSRSVLRMAEKMQLL